MVSADARELQLLSALLAAPTDDSLALLREWAGNCGWLDHAVRELEELPLDWWQAEHTRLFINGYPDTPCLPFASHWRHGCMQGPVVGDLTALLSRIGVASEAMPPDYLGVLLECCALLEREGTPQAQALSNELRETHLEPWLPRFTAALQEHARLRLYRTLGSRLRRLCHDPE